MWRRKWFPWQQQGTGKERPGEEGDGEKGGRGQDGRDGGGESQRVEGMGSTESGWDGSGIGGLRLRVAAKQGGKCQDG